MVFGLPGTLIAFIAFTSFFLGLGVALKFRNIEIVRKVFLVGFITVILTMNISGLSVAPFDDLQKYSTPDDQERTYYYIYVADNTGSELHLDSRAVPAKENTHLRILSEDMVNEYNKSERDEIACLLLDWANDYRKQLINDQQYRELFAFPPHVIEGHWEEDDVESFSTFTRLNIYEFTIESSDDGTEIVSESQELVYSYHIDEGDNQCVI